MPELPTEKCVHCGGDLMIVTMVNSLKRNPCNAQRIDIPADQQPKQLVEIQPDGLGKQKACHSGYVSHYAVCDAARKARAAEKTAEKAKAEQEGMAS